MDIILQLYGLSFLVPGLLILIWPKRGSEYAFARFLWLLGAFGISHGLAEWMALWADARTAPPILTNASITLLLVANLLLFEFGRRLIHISLGDDSSRARAFFSPWLYALMLGAVGYASWSSAAALAETVSLLKYFTGVVGAVMTGVGFLLHWHRHIAARMREQPRIKSAVYVLATAFIAYGVFDAFVPPAGDFATPRIGDELLRDRLFLPLLTAHALCAVIIAIAIIYVLRIFDLEARRRLETVRDRFDQSRESLDETNRKYELLLRTASDGIHVLDIDGNIVEASDAFCRMLGYTREQVLGMNVQQWDVHFSPAELKVRVPMLMGKLTTFETRHLRSDGKVIDVEISTVGVTIHGQTLLYCSSRDITDRKHAQEQLQLVARVFDRAAEGVLITDAEQRILTVNDAFTRVTGYTREEVIGCTPAILRSGKQDADFYKSMWAAIRSNGWWQGEIWNRRKNGELYLEWLSINAVQDEAGRVVNYIGMFSDITLIKESRQRMEFLATHDELTDLPNRTLFNDHLRLALARSARAGTHLALLFVDLDNFKNINDTLGHQQGDLLLKQVAARLKACVRESDTVARLGGDEFVVLLEIEQRNEAALMARRILDAFASSFSLQEHEYFITSSIGISLFPEDATDAEELMRHADTAMYRAKEQGKNTFMFFTADMAERISRRMLVEHALRLALANGELFLEYQPQIDLRSHRIVGVEALLRWRYRDEIIMPDSFIQIAEESGLIVDIDEWVLGEVCRQLRAWDGQGVPPFWVSVNTSARHFRRPDLFSRITGIVDGARISPERLCLEITEGVLMDVERANRTLYSLHDAGFRVSVDDFGTGFSSLSYLKRLPIHEVKVDRSFVDGIATDSDDRSITTAIIAMARGLGLRTVAEGVETEVQQAELKRLGCDIGQGYFYSRPLRAALLREWIANHRQIKQG